MPQACHYPPAGPSRDQRAALLESVRPLIVGMVRDAKIPPGDRDDVVQDCLLELWAALERFSPSKGAVTTFTAAVVRRVLANRKRAAAMSPRTVGMDFPERTAAPADRDIDDGPAAGLDVSPILAALGAPELLSLLTPSQRRVFELVAIEGLDVPRAAEQLNRKTSLIEIQLRQVAGRLLKSGRLPDALVEQFERWKAADAANPARRAVRRPGDRPKRRAADEPAEAVGA